GLTPRPRRDEGGEGARAAELLLPDGPLARVAATDAPFGVIDREMLERYGAATLEAAGVVSSFELVAAHDLDLARHDRDLDEAGEWAEHVLALLPRVTAGAAAVPPIAVEV